MPEPSSVESHLNCSVFIYSKCCVYELILYNIIIYNYNYNYIYNYIIYIIIIIIIYIIIYILCDFDACELYI